MGAVGNDFFERVLAGIHAPATVDNLRACHAWQLAEGGRATWNPWNTTQPEPGSSHYNSFGPHGEYHVLNYPDEATGVRATVTTLENGHYGPIVAAFRAGDAGAHVAAAVDASPWGTHGAAATYSALYGKAAPPAAHRLLVFTPGEPLMRGSDVRIVQERLERLGFSVGPAGADGAYGRGSATAVERLEEHRHLAVDGKVGPRVRHALGLPS